MPYKFNPLSGTLDYFSTPTAAGANTSLSNLGTVSFNSDLLPSSAGARALGSSSLYLSNIYSNSALFRSSVLINNGASSRGQLVADTAIPSGATPSVQMRGFSATHSVALSSQTGVGTTGSIYLETGNSTTAGSGSINLQPGTATTTRGHIYLNGGVRTTVTSVSTTYTATPSDNNILADASSAAFTITLPPVSGLTGKLYTIKKTDSDFTKAVTIDGNGAETIDGATTTTLNTVGETIELICDGTGWQILRRYIPGNYTSYTPTFQGFGTPSSVDCYWARSGANIILSIDFTTGTNTAVEAQVSLPSGLTVNSTVLPSVKAISKAATTYTGSVVLHVIATGGDSFVNIGRDLTGVSGLAPINGNTLSNGTDLTFTAKLPITGWNG